MSCTRPSKHGSLLDLPTTLHIATSSFKRRSRSNSSLLSWVSGETALLLDAHPLLTVMVRDCTIPRACSICRPTRHQRGCYNGHKRINAIKFQSVVTCDTNWNCSIQLRIQGGGAHPTPLPYFTFSSLVPA